MNSAPRGTLTAEQRKALFLELAGRPGGVAVTDVHKAALARGDNVTIEAFYNLARRLSHRGVLRAEETSTGIKYFVGAYTESQWLEEDELASMVDPDYPLLAFAVWRESRRQIDEMPEEVWRELRERLLGQDARTLFLQAIMSYAGNFEAQIAELIQMEEAPPPDFAKNRQAAETERQLLVRLLKYGLGLSKEAANVPGSLDVAIAKCRANREWHIIEDEGALKEELSRRIEMGPFVREVQAPSSTDTLLIGAVDGSTRAGILSLIAEQGDFGIGHAPMVAINTAVGEVNRMLSMGERNVPVFLRLPEKPEDTQREENRYTVMAKLLYPDLSDAQYMHSVWNAMDLIEGKATRRLLKRWYRTPEVEVPPADVVLRDGTVSPQDRDFSHYTDMSTYGRIVRDSIEVNWEIAAQSRENGQTVAGIVKQAQLSVFAPVLNWFACQTAANGNGQLASWPLASMNLMPDQVVLTRLLTAGRKKKDNWLRTAVVLRPFHALTNFYGAYSRDKPASAPILDQFERAKKDPTVVDQEKRLFWDNFRGSKDHYVKMIDNVFYASMFLGAIPRLDVDKTLPRVEVLITAPTAEDGEDPWPDVGEHLNRLVIALHQTGFEVSNEHNMFASDAKLDVLPALIIKAHDTVKTWATELLSRVQEYIGHFLASYVSSKKVRGVRVRPFSKQELEMLYSQLKRDREMQAGARPGAGPKLLK